MQFSLGLGSPKEAAKSEPEIHKVRYASKMFTLLVGPDEEEMVVHGTHLAKSPALARICDGGFAESGSRIIRMPEDDPTCMGCVIRYFYKDDFEVISQPNRKQETVPVLEIGWSAQETTEYPWSAETESTKEANNKPSSDPVALEILAGVYTLAEKYQITDLLDLCLKKMGPFIDLTSDPGSFLWIARIIYDKTLASDKVFRPYFRDHCPAMLMGFGKDKKNGYRVVNEHISEGGDLAVDVFEAYRDLYRIQEILEPDNGAIWFPPGTTDPARVSEIIENHVETLKKKAHRLEFEHAVHHPRCKSHLDDSYGKHLLDCGVDAHGRNIETDLYPVYSLGEYEKLSRWQKFKKYARALRVFGRS